jgi:hypothetical protein
VEMPLKRTNQSKNARQKDFLSVMENRPAHLFDSLSRNGMRFFAPRRFSKCIYWMAF